MSYVNKDRSDNKSRSLFGLSLTRKKPKNDHRASPGKAEVDSNPKYLNKTNSKHVKQIDTDIIVEDDVDVVETLTKVENGGEFDVSIASINTSKSDSDARLEGEFVRLKSGKEGTSDNAGTSSKNIKGKRRRSRGLSLFSPFGSSGSIPMKGPKNRRRRPSLNRITSSLIRYRNRSKQNSLSRKSGGFRQRRRQKNEQVKANKIRSSAIKSKILYSLKNFKKALETRDRDAFCSAFCAAEEFCEIEDPIGILIEDQPEKYFDCFVSIYGNIGINIDYDSIIMNLHHSHPSLHCEVEIISQYSSDSYENALKFIQPQHWHFNFDTQIISSDLEKELFLKEGTKDNLPANEPESTESVFNLRICMWRTFWSMNSYQKLTSRTFRDSFLSATNWMFWARKYGFSFVRNHLQESFNIQDIPREVEDIAFSIQNQDEKSFLGAFSSYVTSIDVCGIFHFSFENKSIKKKRASLNGAPASPRPKKVDRALKDLYILFKKLKCKEVRIVNCIVCGNFVSVRLVLSQSARGKQNGGIIPAFLILTLHENKGENSIRGGIKELSLLTNAP